MVRLNKEARNPYYKWEVSLRHEKPPLLSATARKWGVVHKEIFGRTASFIITNPKIKNAIPKMIGEYTASVRLEPSGTIKRSGFSGS